MSYRLLVVLIVLFLGSCDIPYYTKSDVFTKQATLQADDPLHEKNSLEWWYFTGHLKDKNSDKVYGVEYVFFHTTPLGRADFTLMNFALSDPQTNTFYYDFEFDKKKERMKTQLPVNFRTENEGAVCDMKGFAGNFELSAQMKNHPISVNLATIPSKPALMHAEIGYENYGGIATAGYFSYPRLKTEGQIKLNGKLIEVEGELWYDRQWNCMGVWSKNIGWDWISIQLDNETDIMLYQVNKLGTNEKSILGGTIYTADLENIHLEDEDILLTPTKWWESPSSKADYPIEWSVKIPRYEASLTVKSLIPESELKLTYQLFSMHYWEGMCSVEGLFENEQVKGNSFVEMTNRKKVSKQLAAR